MKTRADFVKDARPIFGTVSTDRNGNYRIACRNVTAVKKLRVFAAPYGATVECVDTFPALAHILWPVAE